MTEPMRRRLLHETRATGFALQCVLGLLPLLAGCRQSLDPPVHPILAAYRGAYSHESEHETDPVAIRIETDVSKPAEARPEAFRAAAAAIDSLVGAGPEGEEPPGVSPPAAETGVKQKWLSWSGLDAQALETQLIGAESLPSDAFLAYAAHPAGAAAVCLINHSDRKVTTCVRIRLPRGVYKIERLRFSPSASIAEHSPETVPARYAPIAPSNIRLDPLEGCDLAAAGSVSKTLTLDPGEACVYRYRDVALHSWQAWCEVQEALHGLQGEAPGPVRRLRRMLSEVSGGLGGLTGGKRHSDTNVRLGRIHHLLLGTAQAESLARNYQTRHVFNIASGQNLMQALVSLSSDLADTSATMLGLSPRIDVTYDRDTPASLGSGTVTSDALVTIRLENTGSRSVGLVKMGLDASTLPSGARCEPADLAFFGTLHPGQTVQAEFHVRRLPAEGLTEERCAADISYFIASVPAHLRPHAWF